MHKKFLYLIYYKIKFLSNINNDKNGPKEKKKSFIFITTKNNKKFQLEV